MNLALAEEQNVPYNKYIDLPIIIETGFTFDDNINRAVANDDKLIDRLFDWYRGQL